MVKKPSRHVLTADSKLDRCYRSEYIPARYGAAVQPARHRSFLMSETRPLDLRREFGRSPIFLFDLFFTRDTMVAVSAEMEFCTVSLSSAFCFAACAAFILHLT